uniref:CUB domain-containing protein n=1 Tax=Ascaris lumbricoides TaxID=6252 RepID=A0A0M3ICI4_ASCLU
MRYLPRFVFTMMGKYTPQRVCDLPDNRLYMVQAYRNGTNCNYDVQINIGNSEVIVDGFFESEEIRQIAVIYDEAWMDLEQSKDKGAPLFVDFAKYLAKQDETVKALYVGDSFVPRNYAREQFLSSTLLIAAIIVVNRFLHFR